MDDMEILPRFKVILCHDPWKPYFQYDCTHCLCRRLDIVPWHNIFFLGNLAYVITRSYIYSCHLRKPLEFMSFEGE